MLVRTLFGGGSPGCVPDGERSLVGAVSRGRLPDEEHFPYFTLLFMDRPATTRSSAPSSHTSTPRTAPPAPSQPIAVWQANILPERDTSLEATTRGDLEAFRATCSPAGRPASPPRTTRSSRSSTAGWPGKGESRPS